MEQVEEALRVLYTTSDARQRLRADAWLQEFQASQESWEIAARMVGAGSGAESRLFGATVLCTKLRGDNCGGLPPEAAANLRSVLLRHLGSLPSGRVYASLPSAALVKQLCRACSMLLGNGGMGALLADVAFAALPASAMLGVLALIPEGGAFLSGAETDATQLLLLAWLQHAYVEGAPFPAPLPSRAAPVERDDAYRIAVLGAACKWAEMPSSDGITLGRLAASPCFAELMRSVDLGKMPIATDPTNFFEEARLAFELCRLVLEAEPTEAVPNVGSRLQTVPPSSLGELLAATTRALEPLATTSDMTVTTAAGEDDVDEDEEAESVEEAGVMLAAVSLAGALLRRASAHLVADSADETAQRLSGAMLQLLQRVVPCSTHCQRAICEGTLGGEFWPPVLRAAAHWAPSMRSELLSTAASGYTMRSTLPPEERLGQWDAVELGEYCTFRDDFLRVAIADVARADPPRFVRACLERLSSRHRGTLPADLPVAWQADEKYLFAATASIEVFLSRVLSPPGTPPPDGAAELAALLPPLLHAALATTTPADSASAACQALMLRSRCDLVEALTPWLALDPAAHGLAPSVLAILPAISHPARVTADAALGCLTQLSRRCAIEMARDPTIIQALFDMLATALPTATDVAGSHSRVERRCQLLKAVGTVVVESPPAVERFFAPIVAALEQARATLEAQAAAAPGERTAAAQELAARIDETAAALAPLKPLPKPSLVAVLTHLWPTWCMLVRAAPAAHVAAEIHPALSKLGCEALRAVRAHFAPLLPQTVDALTAAFKASPSAPLLAVTDSLVDAFHAAPSQDIEASFASLLDALSADALAALAPTPSDQPALLTALLTHADLHAKLIVPSIAASSALPSLVGLAASLLGTCRQVEVCDAAMSLLCSVGAAARTYGPSIGPNGSTRTDEAVSAIRDRMQAVLGGSAGRAIVGGCVIGLADTLAEPSLPCVAELLAPLLHLQSWRATEDGLASWLQAALAELPTTEGAPDTRCRQTLHQVLIAFPDACASGARYHKLVGVLSAALVDFAMVARRRLSASAFVVEAYDWSDAALLQQGAAHRRVRPGFG